MGFNIERADKPFVVKSPYKPSGDQPQAIAELAERIETARMMWFLWVPPVPAKPQPPPG